MKNFLQFSQSQQLITTAGTFYMYSVFCAIAIFFVVCMVPETKGRDLDSIAKLFIKNESKALKCPKSEYQPAAIANVSESTKLWWMYNALNGIFFSMVVAAELICRKFRYYAYKLQMHAHNHTKHTRKRCSDAWMIRKHNWNVAMILHFVFLICPLFSSVHLHRPSIA